MLCCSSGERGQRGTVHPPDMPVRYPGGAETFVELNGGFVPVQHAPFNDVVVPVNRDLRQMAQQRVADAVAALLWFNEQILQEQTDLAFERVDRAIIQRESNRRAAGKFSQGRLGDVVRREQQRVEFAFLRGEFMCQALVFGEAAKQPSNIPQVSANRGT